MLVSYILLLCSGLSLGLLCTVCNMDFAWCGRYRLLTLLYSEPVLLQLWSEPLCWLSFQPFSTGMISSFSSFGFCCLRCSLSTSPLGAIFLIYWLILSILSWIVAVVFTSPQPPSFHFVYTLRGLDRGCNSPLLAGSSYLLTWFWSFCSADFSGLALHSVSVAVHLVASSWFPFAFGTQEVFIDCLNICNAPSILTVCPLKVNIRTHLWIN